MSIYARAFYGATMADRERRPGDAEAIEIARICVSPEYRKRFSSAREDLNGCGSSLKIE